MKCERCGQAIEEVIPPKGLMGRPSVWSIEIAQEICERIAGGEALIDIAADAHMPAYSVIRQWTRAREDFSAMFAQAREDQADWLADQMMKTAMKTEDDWVQDPETGTFTPNNYTVQRAKLILEQMRWNASKLKPRDYGDRVAATIDGTLTHNHRHAHVTIDASAIPAEQREQLRSMLLPMLKRPQE